MAGEVDGCFSQWFLTSLGEGAAGDEDVVTILGVDSVGKAVGEGAPGDGDSLAVFELQKRGSAFLWFGGFFEEATACDGAVPAVDETNTGAVFFGMTPEVVAADGDHAGVFDKEVAFPAGVDGVSGDGDAVAIGEVDVILLGADDVAGDGNESGWTGAVALFRDANIAAAFGLGGLNGVGGDGDLVDACSVGGGIDPNFRGWFGGELGE